MMMRTWRRLWLVVTMLAALSAAHGAAAAETLTPPPNAPAAVQWDAGKGRLSLSYHGGVILDATVRIVPSTTKTVEWKMLFTL
ncbi:MAG: hypothetical protein NTV49_07980 [Kiritimatiellaeota bacterium]|nr:hypothetical protein [Kiritimatiellota bacterium]